MKREAKGSGRRAVNKTGEKPAFAKKEKSSTTGRGFTKKSEMKGWNKKSDDKPVDFRFAKPGSKGKDVDFSKKRTNRTPSRFSKNIVNQNDNESQSSDGPESKRRGRTSPATDRKFESTGFKRGSTGPKRDSKFSRDKDTRFEKGRTSDRSDSSGFKRKGRPTSDSDRKFESNYSKRGDSKFAGDKDSKFEKPRTSSKPERTRPFNKFSRIAASKSEITPAKNKKNTAESDLDGGSGIRLNRYISNAGICSRREADELINAGLVSVNDKIVTELGTKVMLGDVVKFNGSKLSVEERVYILLNKPKDTITTLDDPEGRNTVMDLFEGKMKERIFPVGRLDRNTTGVLLLTNDGELAQRLMHPKYEVFKVYRATLDKPFKPTDMWTLSNGIVLEDGPIKPDAIAMSDPKDKKVVGVEIHSGKNRIIHRMFEHLEYKVDRLDRVLYADLEKGKLKRGEWRHLTEKEVKSLKRLLKMK
jgi:23S rRNA pseudouridine2605 synthase